MECWRLEYITEKDKCFFVYSLNTFVLQMYKFFPPHQAILQCSVDTNWVSYTLVQFWHCLPGISTDPSHRFRSQSQKTAPCPPRFRCQVQIVTCASDWPPENETSHDSVNRNFLSFRYRAKVTKLNQTKNMMQNIAEIHYYLNYRLTRSFLWMWGYCLGKNSLQQFKWEWIRVTEGLSSPTGPLLIV